jgi:diguanylate cyclase (GGDEF)-like protein/PAS domain S-box-containing protein
MQIGQLNRLMRKPLTQRVSLLHVAGPIVLVVLLAVIQIIGLRESHRQAELRAQLNAQNFGSVMAESISGTFSNIDLTLQEVAANLKAESAKPQFDKDSFESTLLNLKNRVPSLESLRVTNADGEVIYGTAMPQPINVSDRDYFQTLQTRATDNMVISPPLMGRLLKRWILICARRYTLPNGRFGGIVYGAIEVEGMAERLSGRKIKMGDQDLFAVVDNESNMIARYLHGKQDMQFVGQKIPSLKFVNFLNSGAETQVFTTVSSVDKVERIFYYQRIAGNTLNLIVGLSTDDAFAEWRREALFAGLTTLIFAIVACSGSYLLYSLHKQKLLTINDLDDALSLNSLVIDNSPVGIQAFHEDGQCMLVNQELTNIVGGTREDILRQNFRRLESWQKSGAAAAAEQALATKQTIRLEANITTTFGKVLRLEWIFTPFLRHGELKLMTIVRDCTDMYQAREALEDSNRKLATLCSTDSLTNVLNRRGFDESLVKEWRRAARSRQPLAMAMIDVDFFKQYNDLYGHQKGDECLSSVARILREQVMRPGDSIARYGGEEFAFIGPGTSLEDALHVMERVRTAVLELAQTHANSPFGCITVSIGVSALIPEEGYTPKSLIRSADEALYRAKSDGRNRVASASEIKRRA